MRTREKVLKEIKKTTKELRVQKGKISILEAVMDRLVKELKLSKYSLI